VSWHGTPVAVVCTIRADKPPIVVMVLVATRFSD